MLAVARWAELARERSGLRSCALTRIAARPACRAMCCPPPRSESARLATGSRNCRSSRRLSCLASMTAPADNRDGLITIRSHLGAYARGCRPGCGPAGWIGSQNGVFCVV